MIRSTLTGHREAIIRFPVSRPGGQEQEVQAVIDTGFNGYLTLPDSLVARLGLSYHSRTTAILGDGSRRALGPYEAVVVWSGQERDVLVLAAEGGPLVGMAMLYGHDVFLNVIEGGNRPSVCAKRWSTWVD